MLVQRRIPTPDDSFPHPKTIRGRELFWDDQGATIQSGSGQGSIAPRSYALDLPASQHNAVPARYGLPSARQSRLPTVTRAMSSSASRVRNA
jgi:hypothetical protein